MATHSPHADPNSVFAEFASARIHTEECQWHDEVPLPHPTAFPAPTRVRSTRRTAPQPTPHIARSVDFSLRRRAPLARSSVKAGRSDEASTRQVFSPALPPVATQLIISNRRACRLEMPESYTKQTTATRSNRHKCRHSFATSPPTCSASARSIDFARRAPMGGGPRHPTRMARVCESERCGSMPQHSDGFGRARSASPCGSWLGP
jgi:hypothetical protein